MTDATTTNYGWSYPTVGADDSAWGGTINTTIQDIDGDLKTVSDSVAGKLTASDNLSDVANAATARTNLGLSTAAVATTTDGAQGFVLSWNPTDGSADGNLLAISKPGTDVSAANTGIPAANVLQTTGNLSGLTNTATARSNIGLGSMATHNVTISSSAPSGGSNGDIWFQYS